MIRLTRKQRKAIIIDAAVQIANKEGLATLTYIVIANQCSIRTSEWTVKHYFPTKAHLFSAVANNDKASKVVRIDAWNLGIRLE